MFMTLHALLLMQLQLLHAQIAVALAAACVYIQLQNSHIYAAADWGLGFAVVPA